MARVVVTGVGVVTGAVTGGREQVRAFLASSGAPALRIPGSALLGLVDEGEARRLSRVCQLSVAAARIALADAGLGPDPCPGLGLVIGAEFGDLRSTIEFVNGYLCRGPGGLSALLFPNTVMNTMAATTAIAVAARGLSLTLNAPTVAGELAIARAVAAVRCGRVEAVLGGGVDEIDPFLAELLVEAGATSETRGEGAGFVLLESLDGAHARGARVLGEIAGVAWRALRARPYRVGRGTDSRAIAAALDEADAAPGDLGRVWISASGDGPRDRWEQALLEASLRPARPPQTALGSRVGRHSGLGALAVAAAARAAGAEVLRHPRRLGKGQAIRTGVAAALSRRASVVVTLDGDGQHDPGDLTAVLGAARGAPRAIVVGSRLAEAGVLPPDRLNAIRVAGFFVNWASGLKLEHTQSGYRAYPVTLFDEVELRHGGFVLETEVLIAAAARGWQVREVPVQAIPRARRRSRFRPLGDGAAIGAYLAGRVVARWAREAAAAGRAVVIGGSNLHRAAGAGPADWWCHPRRRRAAAAAGATLAAPALLALLALQALVPRWLPDVVTPLVRRLCSQARLDAMDETECQTFMTLAVPSEPPR